MRPGYRAWIYLLALAAACAIVLAAGASLRSDDVVVLALVVGLGSVVAVRARQRAFERRNQQGIERYRSGDFEGASAIFFSNAHRFRYPAPIRGISSFNLGLARLRMGDLDGALRLLHAVEQNPGLRRAPVVHRACPLWISICQGVRGDLDEAWRWLDFAARSGRSAFSLELLALGIVLCREGNYEQAVYVLTERRDQIPASDRDDALALVDLVWAFAESNLRSDPRSEIPFHLDPEHRPRRMDLRSCRFLGSSWESFRAFLDVHNLPEN